MNIFVFDEQLNGTVTNQFQIEIDGETVSTQELIEKRVIQEVKAYNERLPEYYKGLIVPTDAEKTLNGFKLPKKQLIDVEKQVYIALDAFQKNAFFIMVDNTQLEELNQQVRLTEHSKVSFVKLTPLIGG